MVGTGWACAFVLGTRPSTLAFGHLQECLKQLWRQASGKAPMRASVKKAQLRIFADMLFFAFRSRSLHMGQESIGLRC